MSFQFDRPVGMVEELFPAFVSLVAEVDVDQGVVAGSGGFLDQTHVGVLRGFTALFYVAGRAGADAIGGLGDFQLCVHRRRGV